VSSDDLSTSPEQVPSPAPQQVVLSTPPVAVSDSTLQPESTQSPLTITLCDGSSTSLATQGVTQSTLLPVPQTRRLPARHVSFGNRVRQVANSQRVRVLLKRLPPANNKDFKFVSESVIAKVIHITFNVPTDPTGSTCQIYKAERKDVRSGHIVVPRHVANVIAAKLAEGVKLELVCGPKENPKVRCTQYKIW
jgi:hypothetical protein